MCVILQQNIHVPIYRKPKGFSSVLTTYCNSKQVFFLALVMPFPGSNLPNAFIVHLKVKRIRSKKDRSKFHIMQSRNILDHVKIRTAVWALENQAGGGGNHRIYAHYYESAPGWCWIGVDIMTILMKAPGTTRNSAGTVYIVPLRRRWGEVAEMNIRINSALGCFGQADLSFWLGLFLITRDGPVLSKPLYSPGFSLCVCGVVLF